ncbi:hypothetical protein HNQ51_000798 [Inhella inkyongensis]|uniref:Chalcone isomerase domain-containing protein n=1 Tax=Inhella inkyongensis TaxID=392593 RepID=A0A840RZS9_9BURK|nr:chalcone isomerase family protein [Inhella inkyongensis]MBB5203505.1 hypothetical protein [Inhella inkyongensis]
MRSLISSLGLGLALMGLPAAPVWAQSAPAIAVAGVDFPTTAAVGSQALILNGAGVSSILSSRATVVGLYLSNKTAQVDAALSMAGAKRLQVVALRTLSARDLSNALLDRIRSNAAPGEVEANVLQIAAVGGVFGTRKSLSKGDVLHIDYLPALKATEFRINGERVAEPIAGEKFYPLMMKVWVGPKVRASTRDALMGGAPSE